jgi:hypothetical protein
MKASINKKKNKEGKVKKVNMKEATWKKQSNSTKQLSNKKMNKFKKPDNCNHLLFNN